MMESQKTSAPLPTLLFTWLSNVYWIWDLVHYWPKLKPIMPFTFFQCIQLTRHMLAMNWNNRIYNDTCLSFGLCLALILHYLDDFLIMDPPTASKCLENLNIIKEVCLQLGVSLALEKLEGPSQSLTFLGIILDTEHMEIQLSDVKLSCTCHQLTAWLGKESN